MRTLTGLCAALLLSACVASGGAVAPPQTVGQVDLSRYQGTWYELARLPMFFQRNCAQSEAHYLLQGDGSIGVTNRCRTLEGEWIEARGGNPFMEIAVPDASLRLIQACGRLLRTEADRGTITLLDRRVVTQRYGKAILNALPPFRREIA